MCPGDAGSQLFSLFHRDASRRLAVLAASLQALAAAAGEERGEHLAEIREAAHGLKGSAAMLGLERIAAVAGTLEERAVVLLAEPEVAATLPLEGLVSELVALCEAVPRSGVAAPAQPTFAKVTRTVVCIEDDPASAALLTRALAQRPWVEVVTATRARDGVELVKARVPDLVLLDLHLPDGSGEQVLAALSEDTRTAAVPVVVMSADAAGGVSERVGAAGVAAYLTKPIELLRLFELVDAYAGASSS